MLHLKPVDVSVFDGFSVSGYEFHCEDEGIDGYENGLPGFARVDDGQEGD